MNKVCQIVISSALGAAFSACGSAHPAASPSPTPQPVAAAPCTSSQLSATLTSVGAGAGTVTQAVVVDNTSMSACELSGWPELTFVGTATGPSSKLPAKNIDESATAFGSSKSLPHGKVAISPSENASFLFSYGDTPVGGGVYCVPTQSLRFTFASQAGTESPTWQVAFPNGDCGGNVEVSPVESGSTWWVHQ